MHLLGVPSCRAGQQFLGDHGHPVTKRWGIILQQWSFHLSTDVSHLHIKASHMMGASLIWLWSIAAILQSDDVKGPRSSDASSMANSVLAIVSCLELHSWSLLKINTLCLAEIMPECSKFTGVFWGSSVVVILPCDAVNSGFWYGFRLLTVRQCGLHKGCVSHLILPP